MALRSRKRSQIDVQRCQKNSKTDEQRPKMEIAERQFKIEVRKVHKGLGATSKKM